MKNQTEEIEKSDLEAIDGELLEVSADSEIELPDEEVTQVSVRKKDEIAKLTANPKPNIANQKNLSAFADAFFNGCAFRRFAFRC